MTTRTFRMHRFRVAGLRSAFRPPLVFAGVAVALLLIATPALASKQVVDFFGGKGTQGGQFGDFSSPVGVAVNDSGAGPGGAGDVYILDHTLNRLQRFGRNDNGTPAIGDDTYFFISAWGADVDSTPSGGGNYEICTVAAECKPAAATDGNGALGSNDGLASGIAVDQDSGDVYVSDVGNNRINVYAGDGAFLRSFGFDVVQSGPDDNGSGFEICKADLDVCKTGSSGAGTGQIAEGLGIAVSQPDGNPSTGTVFLADRQNHRVDTYDLDGSSPGSLGSSAQFGLEFFGNALGPTAVAVDSRGILYAVGGYEQDPSIQRYDTENANGNGVGFLAPILAPADEKQVLTFNATAGQFRLSFKGDTTADLPFDASPSNGGTEQVRKALEALPSIGPGNVRVVQQNVNGVEHHNVEFTDSLASTDVPQLTVSNGTTPLTGTIPVSTTRNGHTGIAPFTRIEGIAVDPDSDGAGPDTDILYRTFPATGLTVGNEGKGIQQFGPLNPPGLTAPPTAVDDTHGTIEFGNQVRALAAESSTGRLYVAARNAELGPGIFVLDNTNPTLPTGTLDSISGVTTHSATAHATITPNGLPATSYHFEYSVDGSKWSSTPTILLGSQETPQAIEEAIDPLPFGLRPNTLYHVRLVYQRRFALPITTSELTFTTDPVPPLVETTGTPIRTTTTARLAGRVDPNDSATTYHFEYGTQGPCDANPCTATANMPAGSGDVFALAAEEVEGLEPSTTYHYRIVADNGVGGSPVFGADATVTTRASDAPLSHGHFPGPPGSDRAYEQVSIPDSNGNPLGELGPQAFSAEGERAVYGIFGGTSISNSGSAASFYFAQRPGGAHPTSGWQTRLISPPRDQLISPSWGTDLYGAPDLSHLIALNLSTGTNADAGERALWHLEPDGTPAKLFDAIPPTDIPGSVAGGSTRNSFAMSADGSRVVELLQFGALDPAYPAAAQARNLYDVSSGGAPQLLSFLSNGSPAACGVPISGIGAFSGLGAQTAHWISADGSLVFFHSSGDDCASKPQLYMRDIPADETKLISGPPLSGPSCEAGLIKAVPGAVFFATSTRLTADDEVGTCGTVANDIYRYDLSDGGLKCLTCLTPGQPSEVQGTNLNQIAVAEDGSRLYFSSPRRLLPGAAAGTYRLDVAGGDLAYVAPVGNIGPNEPSSALTPDGSVLVFGAASAALNPLGGDSDNGGTFQYYRYDDDDRSLLCVSCPSDGSAPVGPAPAYLVPIGHLGSPNLTALSADGSTLAFATATPLLGADQNTPAAAGDLDSGRDLYEWRDGRQLLVTDGITSWPQSEGTAPFVHALSPSGRDLFFSAGVQYTADAIDSNRRLYDARIGGGIEFPAQPKPCSLEVCQGVPKGAGEEQRPGSSNSSALGNLRPATVRPCPKGKRRVRRHGSSRCLAAKRHKQKHERAANHNRRAHR